MILITELVLGGNKTNKKSQRPTHKSGRKIVLISVYTNMHTYVRVSVWLFLFLWFHIFLLAVYLRIPWTTTSPSPALQRFSIVIAIVDILLSPSYIFQKLKMNLWQCSRETALIAGYCDASATRGEASEWVASNANKNPPKRKQYQNVVCRRQCSISCAHITPSPLFPAHHRQIAAAATTTTQPANIIVFLCFFCRHLFSGF